MPLFGPLAKAFYPYGGFPRRFDDGGEGLRGEFPRGLGGPFGLPEGEEFRDVLRRPGEQGKLPQGDVPGLPGGIAPDAGPPVEAPRPAGPPVFPSLGGFTTRRTQLFGPLANLSGIR